MNHRPATTARPTADRPAADRPAARQTAARETAVRGTAVRQPTVRPTARRRFRAVALAVLVALSALGSAACSSGADAGDPAAAPTTAATSVADDRPTIPDAADEASAAPVARTVRSTTDLAVHADPADPEPTRVLPATTEFGSALALLVTQEGTGERTGWYEVLLPGRPNGATGWVRAAEVTVHDPPYEVRVDLAARTLVVLEHGEPVLSTPVAIGASDNPTPTGRFSLTDKLDTGDPAGAYGPFALGLSGRSEVLTEFAGGDGQIGIHGTNDPASIGAAVSHGCVRVPNDVVATLSDMLPLGTPVTVA